MGKIMEIVNNFLVKLSNLMGYIMQCYKLRALTYHLRGVGPRSTRSLNRQPTAAMTTRRKVRQ